MSDYYKKLAISRKFKLDLRTKDYLFKLLKNIQFTKAAGIDQSSGKVF